MNEVFFNEVINAFEDSLVILDVDFKVVCVNDSFLENFNFLSKDVNNKLFFDLLSDKGNIEELTKLLKEILPKKKKVKNFEIRYGNNKKGYKFLSINASQIINDSEKKILLIIKDATKHVKSCKQVIQSEKLSAIGQLSAGIAHGLSGPLTGIQSFLEVYYKNESKDSERYTELKLMLDGCRYMSDIISNLTYFSGKREDFLEELQFNELINSVLLFIERQLLVKGIVLVKDFSSEKILVYGNKAHLQHAILNVLINSMEACTKDNKIIVTTKMLDNKSPCVEIVDEGEGIDAEDLPKVFEPFYSTKKIIKGTGLGLTSARDIIEAHNGKIFINSRKGKGTKVTITFSQHKK